MSAGRPGVSSVRRSRALRPAEGSAPVGSSLAPAEPSLAPAEPSLAPAFYAARTGGWRDYWTLLHPPYTVWHLSYVLLGAALSPAPDPRIVLGALVCFGLGTGVAAHAFDELRGRPLRTTIPAPVLVGLGSVALVIAVVLGTFAATVLGPLFLLFVALGAALVVLYAFEAPFVHSDLGFGLAWGAFPLVTAAVATGAPPLATILGGLAAALLSLAQRRLSSRARSIRRRAVSVAGEVTYSDGSRESIDAHSLIAAPEAALSLLWLAVLAVALAVLASRWL